MEICRLKFSRLPATPFWLTRLTLQIRAPHVSYRPVPSPRALIASPPLVPHSPRSPPTAAMMGPEPPRDEMESLALSDDPPIFNSALSDDRPIFHSALSDDRPIFHSALSSSLPAAAGGSGSSSGGDPLLSPSPSSSYLDPPSYADAVYSPSPSQSHRSERLALSPYASITVSDPETEQDPSTSLVPGGGAYTSYLITTRPRNSSPTVSVRRRFRDVVTLADRLADSHRGIFVPPRPDKSAIDSQIMQKQDFVQQRRSALEKYLRRLAAHPVVGHSDELRAFLMAPGKLPLQPTTDVASRMLDGAVRLPQQLAGSVYAAPQDAAQPAKGGRDLLRMFKELTQSVVNDWGGVKPLAVEEDKEFLEKKEKMQDLEQQLITTSQQAEALVKAQQDIGETMGELGLAFIKLTKFETEEASYDCQRTRAADAKCVATAAVKASRFYRELNAQTVRHLDTLHEYLGLMLSVHRAFSDRANALLTVQTLLSDLTSLHIRAEKLEAASSKIFGGDRSRIRRAEELRESIRVTEEAKTCAVREYEKIKENNRNELERLDRERHDDFLSMLKGFVINQVGYSEKIANVWAKVAEETSEYAK